MQLLVITSCTATKALRHAQRLTIEDFRRGPEHLARREAKLADVLMPASALYTGRQHQRLVQGLREFEGRAEGQSSRHSVEWWILSAGYGLIPHERQIAPYDCTFECMPRAERQRWAEFLRIPQDVRHLLARPFDLGLVLLGETYLELCGLADATKLGGLTVAFCAANAAARLPWLPNLRVVPVSRGDARRFPAGLVGLKGELAARILRRLDADPAFLDHLWDPAADVLELLAGSEWGAQPPRLAKQLSFWISESRTSQPGMVRVAR